MKNNNNKPMPKKVKRSCLTDEIIAEALIANGGIQSGAADTLGYARSTISERISKSEYLQMICAECVEARLDRAEQSLDNMVLEQELGAVCFLLKTRGKHRGYIEDKQPVTFIMKDTAKQIGDELGWKKESQDIQS